jgi:hypothetical protein
MYTLPTLLSRSKGNEMQRISLLLGICLFLSISAIQADIGTYAHHYPPPDCGGYNTILTWDGVVWDQVNVTVGPGYAPGLYSVRLLYYNGGGYLGWTGNINVYMAADGTYTVGPDYEGLWPALSGAYSYYYNAWTTNWPDPKSWTG